MARHPVTPPSPSEQESQKIDTFCRKCFFILKPIPSASAKAVRNTILRYLHEDGSHRTNGQLPAFRTNHPITLQSVAVRLIVDAQCADEADGKSEKLMRSLYQEVSGEALPADIEPIIKSLAVKRGFTQSK